MRSRRCGGKSAIRRTLVFQSARPDSQGWVHGSLGSRARLSKLSITDRGLRRMYTCTACGKVSKTKSKCLNRLGNLSPTNLARWYFSRALSGSPR